MRKITDENITAIHLLNKVLEISDFGLSSDEWDLQNHEEDKHEYLLLKEISILTTLFLPELKQQTVKENIESLLYGKFINKRSISAYKTMQEDMINHFYQKKSNAALNLTLNAQLLESNYKHLLVFKKYIEQWKWISPTFTQLKNDVSFSDFIIDKAFADFNLLPLNNFLAFVIDPKRQSFKTSELVDKYEYPIRQNIISYI